LINNKFILVFTLILISCSSKKNDLDEVIKSDFRKVINQIDNRTLNKDAEELFIDAMTLQQQERWAESLIDLNQALEKDSSAGIYYAIARAYIKLERFELGVKAMEKSLELNSSFLPTLEMLVEMYMQQNSISKALTVYEKILEVDNSYMRRLNYANILEKYKPLESIEKYEVLLEEDPKNEKLILKLLKLYKATNKKDKYVKLSRQYYELDKSNSKIAIDLFDSYLDNKDYKSSLELLGEIDRNISTSELDKFYGTIGYRMLEDSSMNDKEIIGKYLNKVDSRFYFNWRIQLQAGYLYSKIGDSIKTVELFSKALKVSDSIPDIYISIGLHFLQKLNDSLASNFFLEGYQKFNDDYRFPFFLGISNLSMEKYNKSIGYFKSSLELEEEFLDNWIQLGVVYDQIGQSDSSDYYYEQALVLDSLNPLVNNNYAYSLSLRKMNLDKAERMSKIALSMEPNNSAYLDTYSWINYLIGKYAIALEYSEKAIRNGNASAEVYEHYGDILLKLNQSDKALKAYKNSLNMDKTRNSVLEKIKKIESK